MRGENCGPLSTANLNFTYICWVCIWRERMISSQIYVRLFRTFSLEKHKIIPKKVLISYHMISYLHILSKHVHILMYKLSECWRFHQFCARPRLVDEEKLSFRIICIFSANSFYFLQKYFIPCEIVLFLVRSFYILLT